MGFDDKRFEAVRPDSFEPNDCTPQPAEADFEGIRIAAPARVTFEPPDSPGPPGPPDAKPGIIVPICGCYTLKAKHLPPSGEAVDDMRIVARNTATLQDYHGYVVDPEARTPAPEEEEPVDPKAIENLSVGGCFNVDLVKKVELPAEPGQYQVHVTYGKEGEQGFAKSNTATIQLVMELKRQARDGREG